eukprot:jgi/Botrbrau1/5429/Bobra.182_1s0031.1
MVVDRRQAGSSASAILRADALIKRHFTPARARCGLRDSVSSVSDLGRSDCDNIPLSPVGDQLCKTKDWTRCKFVTTTEEEHQRKRAERLRELEGLRARMVVKNELQSLARRVK